MQEVFTRNLSITMDAWVFEVQFFQDGGEVTLRLFAFVLAIFKVKQYCTGKRKPSRRLQFRCVACVSVSVSAMFDY